MARREGGRRTVQALALGAAVEMAMDERELLDMSGPAYRLAARILHAHEGAEDAVQQAFLLATRQLRSGSPPADLRPWFL